MIGNFSQFKQLMLSIDPEDEEDDEVPKPATTTTPKETTTDSKEDEQGSGDAPKVNGDPPPQENCDVIDITGEGSGDGPPKKPQVYRLLLY